MRFSCFEKIEKSSLDTLKNQIILNVWFKCVAPLQVLRGYKKKRRYKKRKNHLRSRLDVLSFRACAGSSHIPAIFLNRPGKFQLNFRKFSYISVHFHKLRFLDIFFLTKNPAWLYLQSFYNHENFTKDAIVLSSFNKVARHRREYERLSWRCRLRGMLSCMMTTISMMMTT
jgi:hypothetical protein